MAYVAPTVTASSATFAQLQSSGFSGIVERILAASSGESIPFWRAGKTGNLQQVYNHVAKMTTEFLRGEPVTIASLETDLKNAHGTFLALAEACSEIGVLIDANQGTLAPKQTGIGTSIVKRTWP
jgi:hypothetical protein